MQLVVGLIGANLRVVDPRLRGSWSSITVANWGGKNELDSRPRAVIAVSASAEIDRHQGAARLKKSSVTRARQVLCLQTYISLESIPGASRTACDSLARFGIAWRGLYRRSLRSIAKYSSSDSPKPTQIHRVLFLGKKCAIDFSASNERPPQASSRRCRRPSCSARVVRKRTTWIRS